MTVTHESERVQSALQDIWSAVLKIEVTDINRDFASCGGDSLLMLRACSLAGKRLGLNADTIAMLLTTRSIAEQCTVITGSSAKHVGLLAALSRDLERTPLFFAPGAGGHVPYLKELADELEGFHTVWGLQSQGLDGGSAPCGNVEEMATAAVADIRTVQTSGPYHVGGHSFGGWVAFEVARQLRAAGAEVALVALVDCVPPGANESQSEKSQWSDGRWLAEIGNVFARFVGADLMLSAEDFEPLADDLRIARLRSRFVEAGVLPAQLGVAQIAAYVRVFKANCLAVYKPAGLYPDTVRLFMGLDGKDVLPAEERIGQMVSGWQRLIGGDVLSTQLPGDHISIIRRPFVNRLADEIRRGSARVA